QPEERDGHAADLLEQRQRAREHGAERGGRCAERDEQRGEAEDEHPGVQRRVPARRAAAAFTQLVEGEPGHERDVARHDRQHARREERDQPGEEGEAEGDRDGVRHGAASAAPTSASSRSTACVSAVSRKTPFTVCRTRPAASIRNDVGSMFPAPNARVASAVAIATGYVIPCSSRNCSTTPLPARSTERPTIVKPRSRYAS